MSMYNVILLSLFLLFLYFFYWYTGTTVLSAWIASRILNQYRW